MTSHFSTTCLSSTERLDISYDGIRRAADLIRHGGVVAFGTETVYGLGALSASHNAVARIFKIKNRPSFNPLINHLAHAELAFSEASMNIPLADIARLLAKHFWPGPLTLVLPRNTQSRICDTASAALSTLALRVPHGRAVQTLLEQVGAPVAAPSANRSGRVSPSTATHVLDGLDGRIDAVLDTGPCTVGVESTVIDLTGEQPVLLRPGGVTKEALEALCGPVIQQTSLVGKNPASPGLLLSHYAPSLPLRLNAKHVASDEALLSFGTPLPTPNTHTPTWNLSPKGDLAEAAARLFAGLRFLDKESTRHPVRAIAVQPFPTYGLGLALMDRLQRAATPRPLKNGSKT